MEQDYFLLKIYIFQLILKNFGKFWEQTKLSLRISSDFILAQNLNKHLSFFFISVSCNNVYMYSTRATRRGCGRYVIEFG